VDFLGDAACAIDTANTDVTIKAAINVPINLNLGLNLNLNLDLDLNPGINTGVGVDATLIGSNPLPARPFSNFSHSFFMEWMPSLRYS
jgi:hypothetical protein